MRDAPPILDLATIFQDSRDHGLQPPNLDRIAREWAPRLGLSQAEVKAYLTENIHYYLDAACLDGLQLFYRYASECGVLAGGAVIALSRCSENCRHLAYFQLRRTTGT